MAKFPLFLRAIVLIGFVIVTTNIEAKPAEIDQHDVTMKMQEIMKAHASHKKVTPQIAKRALDNFIDALDPMKIYFLQNEVEKWLEPDDEVLEKIAKDFEESKFPAFEAIFENMRKAIIRRNSIENKINQEPLLTDVSANEFKDLHFCKTEDELI
ncbi:MAG: tsp3, partial [Chlamydiia bacterium]|nr:tsp3 [Chlamydiia bacterium]